MFGTDLYIALVVGVIISLIYAEKTGIMPAGLIAPGYLAIVFDQPVFLLTIFLISFLTYLIVAHGLSRIMILYGRRKFAAMLSTGIVLKLIFDYFYPILPFEIYEFRGLGVIVPGLIANAMQRQGVVPTVASTLVLTAATFVIITLYYLI
ncbi:poly-gamma-glutamate biosynthesis protein PgsC [Marinococcus halophilus]|uniref:Poly-gamma-glutamate biosynthesis protein PgsC/CapC n=2 Tax=Marinococcus TaxID=1370 RepID=A0A1H2R821_9BACI|nr:MULTISPECIES: poly-gamma-glutamate biosynthesis protein PgsC [Marinococcus]MDZ5782227.1 poly-gamma-glutamate biosynthesis protein PgsC [Marinococcus luteus]OZT80763.1 poly-gamma-glutamate biosynthesis protein PgsC [Marinococcus halophilus]GEK57815.1 PGA biosynthesis protein CapC [Marinococcus halophilus]SDW14994.1 poly-gamma-glutamate biosynthesis protein PgsC/CapC [Marinococcus luteus]